MTDYRDRPTDPPCTLSADTLVVTGACDACGHYSGLHPGIPNPGIDACVVCVLLRLCADLRGES